MIIKSIELKDFRQFKNRQKIVFSTSKTENITLIQGNNTSGKTTLLQAFLWCLYGEANFKSKDSLMNIVTSYDMKISGVDDNVSVAIELEHHGISYYLKRTLDYSIRNKEVKPSAISKVTMSYKEKDGQQRSIPVYEVNQKIKEILPEDLSSYFLYDTERFGNVTTKSDVADAVKGILGLTVLENILNHIGKDTIKTSLLGKFNASLNLKGNQEATDALKNMQEAEDAKEEINSRKKEMTKNLDHYKKRVKEIESELRSLEPSAKLQKDREKLQDELAFEKNSLEEDNALFYNNYQDRSFMFLAYPLMKKALSELKSADVDDKGIKDMNANSIKDIISRGRCVCGTEIIEGNNAHSHLLDEINYLPPESIGSLIKNFKDRTNLMMNTSKNYFVNLDGIYKNVLRKRAKVDKINGQIDAIAKDLEGKASARELQMDLTEKENKIHFIEAQLLNLEEQLWEQKKIITDNQTIYNKNVSATEKNNEVLRYMAYAQAVKDYIEDSYSEREISIKINLERKVNEYFSRIYHGNRRVEIDDKYRVSLITTSLEQEIVTDESKGLETVKNFAFISGLVELAKEKLSDIKNSSEQDSEEYPLILDAPFSNVDGQHVENISKVLPEVTSQLILIVMEKDWKYAEKAMGESVGKRFLLDKKSEVLTEIIEES